MTEQYQWIIYIAQGVWITLQYSVLPLINGVLIGAILVLMQFTHLRLPRYIARAYISLIRGTPLMLQLMACYYALPKLLHVDLSAYAAGIIAMSVNSGAYVAEIIRSGINGVDKGQFEAAKTLSVPYIKMMKDIILPQAIRNIIPSLVNEMINLVKESAIISVIGELDIMRRAQLVAAEKYTFLGPLMVAAVTYYILIMCLTFFTKTLEKKMNDKYK